MKKNQGIVAAGHPITAQAATEILRAGGNAFDAALAALFASCVAEPVLASLGGGGFLLASSNNDRRPVLFDFFTQTPRAKRPPGSVNFFPIWADFGTTRQEFHIGMGSIATPGVIKGIFAIHRELGSLPMREIAAPACDVARAGIEINALQSYISDIISPIIKSSPGALKLHTASGAPDRIAREHETVYQYRMADTFEQIAREGDALFYLGEMGVELIEACRTEGGYLQPEDLAGYRVVRRRPLELDYHAAHLFTNPAPSVGGTLIAFALALLEPENLARHPAGSLAHMLGIAHSQRLTQQLRREKRVDLNMDEAVSREILSSEYLESYRASLRDNFHSYRGTTQISIADAQGNMASMTLSNGEGSGYVLPGTGIMLNNMLGEEDINPHGFHQWPENRRIASMMSPTLVLSDSGQAIATGSGGSNRIRSAILQVLVNLLDFDMGVERAVEHPRLHFEDDLLHLETGPEQRYIDALSDSFRDLRIWPAKNLFFGGAHTVVRSANGELSGRGDSRRGGVCVRP